VLYYVVDAESLDFSESLVTGWAYLHSVSPSIAISSFLFLYLEAGRLMRPLSSVLRSRMSSLATFTFITGSCPTSFLYVSPCCLPVLPWDGYIKDVPQFYDRTMSTAQTTTDQLPENWETREHRLNGNAKLIAEYVNKNTGEKVTVTPYKSYSGAGFCNSHQVEYWSDSETWETVAKGLSRCEFVDDAEQVALEKIREVAHP